MGSKKITSILSKKYDKRKRFINLYIIQQRNYLKRVNLNKPRIMKRAKVFI